MESSGPDAAAMLGGAFVLVFVLVFVFVGLAMTAVGIIAWWKIFSKAGYSGAMGLLMLVPIVNFIMILVLAFGQWPIHRELEQLRASQRQ